MMALRKNLTALMISISTLSVGSLSAAQAADAEALPAKVKEAEADVKFFGRVSQVFRVVNGADGARRTDIVDNDNSNTEFGFKGKYKYGDLFSSVKLVVDVESETTDELNFDSGVGGPGLDDFPFIDAAAVWFGHNKFGAISIGFDDIASDGSSEIDLSSTTHFSEADVDDIGGELQFGNSTTPVLGDAFEVDDFFSDLDPGAASRILYQSPKFKAGPGQLQFEAAARVIDEDPGDPQDSVQFAPDASIRYSGELENGFEFDSSVAYRRTNDITIGDFEVDSNTFHGSFSLLAPTGISVTFGAGIETFENSDFADPTQVELDDDQLFLFGKLGHKAKIFDIGKTAFAVDVFYGEQIEDTGDTQFIAEAFSVGAGVSQSIKPLSLDIFAAARYYSVDFEGQGAGDGFLDNTGAAVATPAALSEDPDGIFVFFSGFRAKF